jgi:hypothetical protein
MSPNVRFGVGWVENLGLSFRIKQSTRCITCPKLYFVIKLYMFRESYVPIIRSYLLYTWQLVCFMQVMWPLGSRVRLERSYFPPLVADDRHNCKLYQSLYTVKKSCWWAEILPETCRVVIPIKLELSASVGFIHKEFGKELPTLAT